MFVDTSGWASIADRWQSFHARASALVRPVLTGGRTLVTTNFVLVELTALLTSSFLDLCSRVSTGCA